MSDDDEAPLAEEPTPSRAALWLRRLFIVLYIAACFLLGSAFIYVSSLEVSTSFEVYGRPRVLAGQSALFRAWARDNNTLGPLTGARLTLSAAGDDGVIATETTRVDTDSGGVFALPIPADTPAGVIHVTATLEDGDGVRESLGFDVTVDAATDVGPILAGGDIMRTRLWDGEEGPHRAELIAPGRVVASQIPNTVVVRVTDRLSGAPVPDARVSFELAYANIETTLPEPTRTDDQGLATVTLNPIGETEWRLITETPDGVVSRSRAVLHADNHGNELRLESSHLATPEGDLRFDLVTVHEGRAMHFELMDDARWIATYRRPVVGAEERVRWKPSLNAPEEARLVTLIACPNNIECASSHARAPVLWAPEPLTDAAAIAAHLEALRSRDVDPAYLEAVSRLDLGELEPEELSRLQLLLAYRTPTHYTPLEPLLVSDVITQARLDAFKAEFRGQVNVILALTLIAGLLIVMIIGVSSLLRRQRETASVLSEIEASADELMLGARERRLSYWMWGFELVVALLTIVVFVWGILLLFQHL